MDTILNLIIAFLFAMSPECATEDSVGFCHWNAETMGNGPERTSLGLDPGRSFVMIGENPYYLDEYGQE